MNRNVISFPTPDEVQANIDAALQRLRSGDVEIGPILPSRFGRRYFHVAVIREAVRRGMDLTGYDLQHAPPA